MAGYALAQSPRGELRVEVTDSAHQTLTAAVEIVSEINQIHRIASTDAQGRFTAQDLPFGLYTVRLSHEGFQTSSQLIRISSEVPVKRTVTLELVPLRTTVDVTDAATLVDPNRTSTIQSIGSEAIRERLGSQPGRALLDLINAEPGWLYEGNGVLHPRGSEYDVQFVMDGVPIHENRSPAFAPNFESDDVDSMRVFTSGYPAEYGRKLGGIVELSSPKDAQAGWHGDLALGGGSFASENASARLLLGQGPDHFSFSGFAAHSDRYLDPPVLRNFTNAGSSGGGTAAYSRDLSSRDRLRVKLSESSVRFEVPNELVQELAGQRQDRDNQETSGLIYFQHVISPAMLLDAEGSVRDASANLWSNPDSVPMIVGQQRGFREGYVRADLSWHAGQHDFKIGADGIFSSVQEALQYSITNPTQFDPDTPPRFIFAGHALDREHSAFVQDSFHFKNWNVSAGIRFDRYHLLTRAAAWSPRLAVSRYLPSLSLLVHVAYDRAFQTPAIENLLLASSPATGVLNDNVQRLPVPPSRGNLYEIGFSRGFFGKIRIEANVFRRDFRNYADDDLLLNTGISFPVSFADTRVRGEEIKLDAPRWKWFSGFVSYSNQLGIAQGPVTGGLFLGDNAASVLTDNSKFYVSQDQRNTARARFRVQASRRAWIALGASYGSGLPSELDGSGDYSFWLAQYGAQILSRVNFQKQRVRPSYSLDVDAGVDLLQHDRRALTFEAELTNLTNHLNLINFASLFSGTAIGTPRSASLQLRFRF